MSHDAPASDTQADPGQHRSRGKYWWLRWVLIALAVIVLAVELALVRDQLAKAWKSLVSANPLWVLAAVVALAVYLRWVALLLAPEREEREGEPQRLPAVVATCGGALLVAATVAPALLLGVL